MTRALIRGYTFYEARGFQPRLIVEQLQTLEPTDRLPAAIAAQTVDLMWTCVITTTALDDVPGSIRAFGSEIKDIPNVPSFVLEMYSEEFCQKKASSSKDAIEDLKNLLDGEFYSVYRNRSVRKLALERMNGLTSPTSSASSEQELDMSIKNFMEEVWYRHFEINGNLHSWPTLQLEKSFFKRNDDSEAVKLVGRAPALVEVKKWNSFAEELCVEFKAPDGGWEAAGLP
jgi:hypothetical protein